MQRIIRKAQQGRRSRCYGHEIIGIRTDAMEKKSNAGGEVMRNCHSFILLALLSKTARSQLMSIPIF